MTTFQSVTTLTEYMFASSPFDVTIEKKEVTNEQGPANGGDHTKKVAT